MTHSPVAAANRGLLAQLACEPDLHVTRAHPAWAGCALHTVARIRAQLVDVPTGNPREVVAFEVLHRWRTDLDDVFDQLASSDPVLWRHWCQPGTWLDSLLRLRSVLAHVVAKAYWDDTRAVAYADMDVPRYLWGAR